ncbi:MAG: L-lysine 6-transaminase [Candidatus Kariarchaeaceae archaeon]
MRNSKGHDQKIRTVEKLTTNEETIKMEKQDIIPTLRKHLLIDGFDDIVVDLEKSQGSWIHDSLTGKKVLDFFSFFASAPIGFNHPEIMKKKFQKELAIAATNKPSCSDFYTEQQANFVEIMSKHVIPKGFPHLFLISGGALAVENALKTAFDWKVRKNIANGKGEKGGEVMHFTNAFHGRTGYTLSLTNTADPRKYMYFPMFDWPRIEGPAAKFPLDQYASEIEEKEKKAIEQMEKVFKKRKNKIAAILIEPIQGEGGDIHFRKEFFQELRRLADEYEAMLIFDEVQTGMGLTGTPEKTDGPGLWAYEHYGVKPDIIAFGKKTQVCGIMVSERVDEVEKNVFKESSRINSTFGGVLSDMVRAGKYIEIIVKEKLADNARDMGARLMKHLYEMAEVDDRITNVRGLGLMCAFDLPTPELRDALRKKVYENNVIILPCGTHSIRFRPPLNISTEEIDIGIEAVKKSLKEI